jgi:hypothetical protein
MFRLLIDGRQRLPMSDQSLRPIEDITALQFAQVGAVGDVGHDAAD